ncbi:MAG TPA: ATP-dependent protease, partial [Hyphomicrobium sp.]|nr:ATP-dependent protease [Hyphomicrobium sp.]
MVFWRSRSEKKAEAPVTVQAETPPPINVQPVVAEPDAANTDDTIDAESSTNVVTLVTSRLADRLADVAPGGERRDIKEQNSKNVTTTRELAQIKPVEQTHFFGQKRAIGKIRAALGAGRGEHLVVLGEPGTGRLELAEALGTEVDRAPAGDW